MMTVITWLKFRVAVCQSLAVAMLLGLASGNVWADVILTFDQNAPSNMSIIETYGDNVTQSPDANGHGYDIIGATTPDIEALYFISNGSLSALRVAKGGGYGNLDNALYKNSSNGLFDVTLRHSDPNANVYLRSFDLAAAGLLDLNVPNVLVLDANDDVIWQSGTTLISSTTRSTFSFIDANGFGPEGIVSVGQLRVQLDLRGLNQVASRIGLSNIRYSQFSAVPEPSSLGLVLIAGVVLLRRRRQAVI